MNYQKWVSEYRESMLQGTDWALIISDQYPEYYQRYQKERKMAWNNNGYNNFNRGGYNNFNNNNNGYNGFNGGGYNNFNNNRNNRPKRKRSGCTSGVSGDSRKPWVRGWKASRQGLVTIICGPNKGTNVHESRTGRNWENWTATVQVGMAAPYLVSCLYDQSTGKVSIEKLGLVLNPKAPNGGYCGRFGQPKNRR